MKTEIRDLEKKLLECSKSREEIGDELRKKADELEKSNLTREEISQKIAQLLMIRSSFDEIRKDMLRAQGNYSKTKDNFNRLQDGALRIKEEENHEAVMNLEKTKKSLWITVFFYCLLWFCSLSHFYQQVSTKKTKKR